MPAITIPQQKLFGMALAQKRGKAKGASKKVKALAKSMSEKKLKEFASTKHEGLKESFALTFNQFISESNDEVGSAYVTPEGELKGLEFTPEEKFELRMQDQINGLIDFFKDAGAQNVRYRINDAILSFKLMYQDIPIRISFNLDTDEATMIDISTDIELFKGTSDSLMDLLRSEGFDFIQYGQ